MSERTGSRGQYYMRIKYLPRPEYYAMVAMVKRWHLDDQSELFAMLVRLASEVMRYQDGKGEQWIMNVLDALRSMPEAQRVYEL